MVNPVSHDEYPSPLFVWRGQAVLRNLVQSTGPLGTRIDDLFNSVDVPREYDGYLGKCPFCDSDYDAERWSDWPAENGEYDCPFCGFFWEFQWQIADFNATHPDTAISVAIRTLKSFDINNRELTLSEIGSHLKRQYSDVYNLEWRRFEELVADVYRNLGYDTRVTQSSRDGGYDIVLVENSSGNQILVECKRYKKANTVGISIVDRLLGVQLRTGIPRAKLVTTSGFTKDATNAASQAEETNPEFEIELVDAERLLEAFQVYNEKLPPLHLHPRLCQG